MAKPAGSCYYRTMNNKQLFAIATTVCLLTALPVFAGPFDPPPTYYNTATGTGATLQGQLHNIIDNHTIRSYGDARSILQDTDVDPSDPDRMLLVYNRVSLDVSVINPGGSIPGWDSGASWNREHTWPRSLGVGSSGADNSDLHQLRPSNPSINSSRGNRNFGGVFGAQSFGAVSDGGTKWYPGDADAGMIARQEFYMEVRYDGSDSNTVDLTLVNGNPGTGSNTLGTLDRLIEWHYEAVPDDFELRRNDVIYDSYQFNRNPFIDRPEFVWSVFVDQNNDSQIAINGAAIAGDGSTSATVDLGRVLVGGAVPASQSVTIDKLGNNGTYYEVTAAGDATSTVSGRYNAFSTGGVDSTSFDVGLSTSTGTAGLRSGTVTIDNLDITTGAGAGMGDSDANDVLTVTLDVLDHADPSFNGVADQNVLNFDFGSVALGATDPTFNFDIFNLEDTASFTAALDLDGILGSGDTGTLTTDLATFSNLDAGLSSAFTATLDTAVAGMFSATYTLSFSDEDVDGAIGLGDLTLMLSGEVTAGSDNADFDGDGDVDGVDFLIWQRGNGSPGGLAQGDANNSGAVDAADLAIWQSQYGVPPLSGLASVPEPSSLTLVFASCLFVAGSRYSTKRRSA